jgi:hypothetical protein
MTIFPMKKTFIRFVLPGSLWLITLTLLAQRNTNNTLLPPLNLTVSYQPAQENDRSQGERGLLPPGLKEKMELTSDQKAGLKPIEDDFADTSAQYQAANQPRIDAAQEANRRARATQDAGQIQAARKQLQDVWAGLQPDRDAAVVKIKPMLTPEQIKMLEDPANQWPENHGAETNIPSSN